MQTNKLTPDQLLARQWMDSLDDAQRDAIGDEVAGIQDKAARNAYIIGKAKEWERARGIADDRAEFRDELRMRKSADRMPEVDQLKIIDRQLVPLTNLRDFLVNDPERSQDYGPWDARAHAIAKELGIETPGYDYAAVQIGLTPAEIRKALTGTAASEQELADFKKTLPNMANLPSTNLEITEHLLKNLREERERLIGMSDALGYDRGTLPDKFDPEPNRIPHPYDRQPTGPEGDQKKKPQPVKIKSVPSWMLKGN